MTVYEESRKNNRLFLIENSFKSLRSLRHMKTCIDEEIDTIERVLRRGGHGFCVRVDFCDKFYRLIEGLVLSTERKLKEKFGVHYYFEVFDDFDFAVGVRYFRIIVWEKGFPKEFFY